MGAKTTYRLAAAAPALVLWLAGPAHAQRVPFVDALIEFHSSLFGTYGDEGPSATAALARMETALDAWVREQNAATVARPGVTAADRAVLHADHLQFEAAVAAMKEAIAAEPARPALYLYLGALHDALGQPDQAAAAFRAARALDPSDPVAAYLGGGPAAPLAAALVQATARGGRRPVLPHFAVIADLSAPARVFAPHAYAEGFALIARRQFREAIAAFRAAAARDPLVADPAGRSERVRSGVAALRARRGTAAIEQLEAAVREYPASSEARRVLGVAYRASGRLADAVASFESAVTLAPGDERARVALGSTLAEAGRLDEAERVLRAAIERLPLSGEARWTLSEVYERQNEPAESLAILDDASALNVVAGRAHLYWRIAQVAHLYFRDNARVIDVLTRRVRVVPNEPHAHKDLGLAYARAGMDDEALVELLMTGLLGLEDAETLTAIGQVHVRQGRLDEAETALRRAVTLDAGSVEARYALAQTLQRRGRATEAAEHFAAFEKLRQALFDEQRRKHERESRP